jgi:signal transduction histidine kinase
MDTKPIEPGVIRTFRYFTGIAMLYFATLVAWYTTIQSSAGDTAFHIQAYVNFGIQLLLLGYLYWGWLRRKLKNLYLPIALLIATVVPTFSTLIYLTEPQEVPYLIITRSWLLFPVLVVPFVLIAWQYHFRVVIAFIIFSSAVEVFALLPRLNALDMAIVQVLGTPILRGFALGIVGDVISQLIETQRKQRKELLQANLHLSQHAETLEQLATSRERNRLARELHDTLAHTLSGLAVNLEAIRIKLGDTEEHQEIHQMLTHSLENTRTGLTETRRALKDLRVKQLDDLGLPLALQNLAQETALRANFDLTSEIEHDLPDISPHDEQCIYRIAQESLKNISQHAQASQVRIRLSKDQHHLRLEIEDDGVGFPAEAIDPHNSLGLSGMKERARTAGGELTISSAPQSGTRILFSLELLDEEGIDL